MSTRNRTTWAADRKAGQAPADPGYGTEDQDHPAHQAEPGHEKYKKGDPDAWAETPNPPPYPEGNPPADPGYDTEDQDHPAHQRPPRVQKLSAMVEQRAAKCLHIAANMLGKKASKEAIEMQALDLMDLPDAQIEATLGRMGGGFLGMDDMLEEPPMMGMDDEMLDEPADDLAGGCHSGCGEEPMGEPMDDMFAMGDMPPGMEMFANAIKSIASDVKELKAGQNAPQGGAAKKDIQSFDRMDTAGDGFLMASDWTGSRELFAAIDQDGDGIIARDEFLSYVAKKKGDDEEEVEVEEEVEEEKDDDDGDEKEGKKKAADDDDDDDDEEKEDDGKEAAAFFAASDDPMGLGTESVVTAEDEAMLGDIFASQVPGQSDVDATLQPQPKEASTGVTTVGTMERTASEGDQLASLWESAPDVKSSFDM